MDNKELNKKPITRRDALKIFGAGTLGIVAATSGISAITGCASGPVQTEEAMVGKRPYKGTDEQVSLLGFGMMRLPRTGEGLIDEELSQKLVDYAYAHGVNYFDTAWNYIGGNSEPFTGKALKKYPRESVYIATKMPSWIIDSLAKGKEVFQAQLDRLQTTYVDYYLLHAIGNYDEYVKTYRKTGVLDYLKEEKKAGRIRHLGFSFHGDMDSFDKLIADSDWDFIQIQMNYYDWEGQDDAKTLYKKLEEKGIPVIVMEPCRGGMLAKLTPDAEEVLKDKAPKKSIASWAFRFCGSQPGVLTILSGMNVLDHIKDNISTLSTDFKPFKPAEIETLNEALSIFKRTRPVRCTTCRYCMPCKFGVDIPAIFSFYNGCVNESKIPDLSNPKSGEFKKRKKAFLARYSQIPDAAKPEHCIKCGACMKMCPQHIRIPDELSRIAELAENIKNL